MAYEEISSSGGGDQERAFVSAKIGTTFEGTFQGMSGRMPSKFGGEYRIVSLDLTSGEKVAVPAGKILLERLEAADLSNGDGVKIVVESATSKASGRQYALPRVYVDRGAAPAATSPVADDDNPPF